MELILQTFHSKQFQFGLASPTGFFEIKHFLKQHKENNAARNELIYTVHAQATLIGLVRLVPLLAPELTSELEPSNIPNSRLEEASSRNDEYWLRGLFIAPDFRGQRLATKLLNWLQSDLKERFNTFDTHAGSHGSTPLKPLKVHAFPHEHLKSFYEHAGFISTDPNELPFTLKTRYQNAIKNRKNWLCMTLVI